MDSVDQSDFFLGQSEKSAREGFPIFCAERLQAVKWRNWKLHFMRQDTMFDPPVKNPVPTIHNLFTDFREEKPTADSWVVGPILKIVGEYEQSVKKTPLLPMGTPDPHRQRQHRAGRRAGGPVGSARGADRMAERRDCHL